MFCLFVSRHFGSWILLGERTFFESEKGSNDKDNTISLRPSPWNEPHLLIDTSSQRHHGQGKDDKH